MRKRAWRILSTLLLLISIGTLQGQKSAQLEDFELEGVAVWQCQCPAYGCPCQQNGLPVHGMCHASDFAHIRKGHYGNVALDGLNVALVGNLVDGTADRLFATLYTDRAATAGQAAALKRIVEYMNEQANQPPVPFRKVRAVPFSFHESADQSEYAVEIPGILQEKVRLPRDSSGKPRFRMPAMDLWSNTVHNADNVQFKYGDQEAAESWDYSGHYANLKYFQVTRTMYAAQKMLGQLGDNSGKWTAKQLEIIHEQKLDQK